MSNEKKVIFSGQDNVSSKSKVIFNSILSDAKKYTDSLKEQNSYINEQVKALEKKVQLSKTDLQAERQTYFSSSDSSKRVESIKNFTRIKAEAQESSEAVTLLKELLKETKKTSSVTEKAEKEKERESKRKARYEGRLFARQEVADDPDKVRNKILRAEKERYEGRSSNDIEKLEYQKTLLKKDTGKPDSSTSVFLGVLAAGLVQQIVGAMSKIVGAQSGEEGFNSLLGGIPLVGSFLQGGADRSFQEQLGIQTKELELSAKTGKSIKGLSNQTNLGYSTRETLSMTEGLINASGSAKGANQTSNALLLQRGLSLSPEVITQIVKDVATVKSSSDIMEIVSDVIRANPELRKDQTKFAAILQQTSQLTNTLAAQSESVSIKSNAGMVGALRSIGGSFSDPSLGPQRMLAINQALTNPGTDFQKARSFGVLSGQNPGMSYFQTLEAQEQGIGKKGYLSGMLKQLQRETGGGENFMLGVNQNLGLGASTSRKLVEAYNKNPQMFDSFAGKSEDIESVLGLSKRAESNTSQRDKEKAEIDNAFAISAAAGDMKVAALTFEAAVDNFKDAAKGYAELTLIDLPKMLTDKIGNGKGADPIYESVRGTINSIFGE